MVYLYENIFVIFCVVYLYIGTTERVCLITGTVDSIMAVLDFIMDKIKEKPDLTKQLTEYDNKLQQDRDKQVKILVPNSTAGMIIGKAGNYIKQIKETSGSYVQISQKAKDLSLQERCITVIGKATIHTGIHIHTYVRIEPDLLHLQKGQTNCLGLLVNKSDSTYVDT